MVLAEALRAVPLENLSNLYSVEDSVVTTNNRWVLIVSALIAGFALLLFVGLSVTMKAGGLQNSEIRHILGENAITFLLVGAVEVVFFLFIAFKFVPVLPSVAIKSIIDRAKLNLS
jgi:hypothetical protein